MSTPRAPTPSHPGDDSGRASESVTVRRVEFPALADSPRDAPPLPPTILGNVEVTVAAVLGAALLNVRDVINLRTGMVIALDRMAGEPVDVRISNVTIAGGEVIVIDDRFAVRINTIGGRWERRENAPGGAPRNASEEGPDNDAAGG
jgi:flagellar motor switch protein FliN/FliY